MEGENHYKKGLWTEDEDRILLDYIKVHGRGQWNRIPKMTGLKRCGKSCRLRWMNYLSPNVKRGHFSEEEDDLIIRMHNLVGNRWSLIAGRVPGRTDNQVKNHWNTHLCKKHGIKKEIGKVVGSSSITHFPQVFNHPRQDDTNPNKRISFNTTSAAAVGCTTNQDPSVNGIEAYSEQAQSLGKHNFESIWFTNDYVNLTSPGLAEFVDAYHLNLSWENL